MPGAMPTRRGTCSRPRGLTWAVTPARGREKSRGPSCEQSRPLNSASYCTESETRAPKDCRKH
eukprot:5046750-Prymnesium_polylepis.1